MEEKKNNAVLAWIKKHVYVLLVIGGVLLIVLTLKTQTVLITDTDQKYTVQLEYTMFGYCVSAVPMTDEARNIATEHMFLLGGMDKTVQTTMAWIHDKSGQKGVKIYVTGYPRSNKKLVEHFCQMAQQEGIPAQELTR